MMTRRRGGPLRGRRRFASLQPNRRLAGKFFFTPPQPRRDCAVLLLYRLLPPPNYWLGTAANPGAPLWRRPDIAGRESHEATMRIFSVWVFEFLKLIGRRPLYPLNAECPFCHQMVRMHYNKAGRRHLFAHARAYSRALYEGYRYGAHYSARMKCLGSGTLATFDPRPNEKQRFGTPKSL
jgi:hypothetical protein